MRTRLIALLVLALALLILATQFLQVTVGPFRSLGEVLGVPISGIRLLSDASEAAEVLRVNSAISNTSMARADLYIVTPIIVLFLLAAGAMLARGMRRFEFALVALPIAIAVCAHVIELQATARMLDGALPPASWMEVFAPSSWIADTAMAALSAVFALYAYRQRKRNWLVIAGGAGGVFAFVTAIVLVLLGRDVDALGPSFLLMTFTLGATALARLLRGATVEDAPEIKLAPRAARIITRLWPALSTAALTAIIALFVHLHQRASAFAAPSAAQTITALALSGEGDLLAIASADGEIEIRRPWGHALTRVPNSGGAATRLIFDRPQRNGRTRDRLIYATALGRVGLVDAKTGEDLATDNLPQSSGPALISARSDLGALYAGQLPDGGGFLWTERRSGDASAIERTNPIAMLLGPSEGTAVAMQAITTSGEVMTLGIEPSAWRALISTDGGFAISAPLSATRGVVIANGQIRLMPPRGEDRPFFFQLDQIGECHGKILAMHEAWIRPAQGVGFERLSVITDAGSVCIVTESEDGWTANVRRLGVTPRVAAISWRTMIVGLANGTVWSVTPDGELGARLAEHGAPVTSLALSAGPELGASGAANGSVHVFSTHALGGGLYGAFAAISDRARAGAATRWSGVLDRIAPADNENDDAQRVFLRELNGAWAMGAGACGVEGVIHQVSYEDGLPILTVTVAANQDQRLRIIATDASAGDIRAEGATGRLDITLVGEDRMMVSDSGSPPFSLTRCSDDMVARVQRPAPPPSSTARVTPAPD